MLLYRHITSYEMGVCIRGSSCQMMLQVIAYNKIDLPDSGDYIDEVREFLLSNGLAEEDVHAISAVTGQGVLGVVRRARQVLDQLPAEVSSAFLCTSLAHRPPHMAVAIATRLVTLGLCRWAVVGSALVRWWECIICLRKTSFQKDWRKWIAEPVRGFALEQLCYGEKVGGAVASETLQCNKA